YDPASDFTEGSTVALHVCADDQADPCNCCDSTYAFTVGSVVIDPASVVSGDIGPEGGTVTDTNTGIVITVPANAVDDTVEICISQAENLPPLPEGLTGMELSCHFGPDGFVFEDTVLVRIPYTQEDLDHAGVTDPMDLMVYYYHTTSGQWIQLPVDSVDTVEFYLFVKVTEFCYVTYVYSETGVDRPIPEGSLPMRFMLSESYPNPFNPETYIQYHVPEMCHVHIAVYNSMGRLVCTLVDEEKTAGVYELSWDGRDDSDMLVSTGVYLFIMKAENQILVKKVTLMK
ncbi:T9SS type A sorting domain-containing protein, partial [bacterium]|nr:T9SS type A sorting domain-containing protein [bacterium]